MKQKIDDDADATKIMYNPVCAVISNLFLSRCERTNTIIIAFVFVFQFIYHYVLILPSLLTVVFCVLPGRYVRGRKTLERQTQSGLRHVRHGVCDKCFVY